MSRCYIIGAGDCDKIEIKDNDPFVIAADGGLEYCKKNNISPSLIVGDFDSLGYCPDDKNVIRLPVEKDETDISYALKYAMEKGFREFVIYGGCGGKRPDHTYANIVLTAYASKNGARVYLVDRDYIVTAVADGEISFPDSMKGDISLFAFGGDACGVYEKGLYYTVEDAVIKSTDIFGVSNSFTGEESVAGVKNGTLIIYFSKPIDK